MKKPRFTLILLWSLFIGATVYYFYASLVMVRDDVLRADMLPLCMASVVVLMALWWRGWRYTTEAVVLTVLALSTLLANPQTFAAHFYTPIFVSTVVAAVLLSPGWVVLVFVANVLFLALAVGAQLGNFSPTTLGPTFEITSLILEAVTAFIVALSSALSRQAQRAAEQNAGLAAIAQERAERKAAELVQANTQMNQQLEQQRQLLELVATLETPVTPLADGVIFAPIVGHLDTRRAQTITTRLLQQASALRARLVVIDIAGVSLVDSGVAQSLLQTAQALRLLGCQVVFSGISVNVALTLTNLNASLEGVATVRSPQEALALYAHTS